MVESRARAAATAGTAATAPRGLTADRVLAVALDAFGTRGFEATSLDDLAAELGVRKQTILYYFPSKDSLLGAVIDAAADELVAELERTLARTGRTRVRGEGASEAQSWERIEAVVSKAFRLGARRPALLGLLREVTRLGPPNSSRLASALDPLVGRAKVFLEAEMAAGRLRSQDADAVLFTAYWAVLGLATEVEAQRALGVDPSVRSVVRRRNGLLRLLRTALEP